MGILVLITTRPFLIQFWSYFGNFATKIGDICDLQIYFYEEIIAQKFDSKSS